MHIKTHITRLTAVALAAVLIAGGAGLYTGQALNNALAANATLARSLRNQADIDAMLHALHGDVLKALLNGATRDTAQRAETQNDVARHRARIRSAFDANRRLELDTATSVQLRDLETPLELYIRRAQALLEQVGNDNKAAAQLPALQQAFVQLARSLASITERMETQLRAEEDQAQHVATLAARLMTFVTVLGAALTGLMGLAARRYLHSSFGRLQRAVQALLSGSVDLTRRLPSMSGECGNLSEALNAFIRQLHDILSQTREQTHGLAGALRRAALDQQSVTAHIESQASTLEQTALSMARWTEAVKRNAAGTRCANDEAERAAQIASSGGQLIGEVINAVSSLADTNGTIAGIIDALAVQTDHLGQRVALQAARTREPGCSPADIAIAAGDLARCCTEAAAQIRARIDDAAGSVNEGNRAVQRTADIMAQIIIACARVNDMITTLAVASREQQNGIDQATRNVMQVDSDARQNVMWAEQSAATTIRLAAQAEALIKVLSRVKLEEARSRAATVATVVASGRLPGPMI